MKPCRVFNVVLCIAVAPFVISSVGGIKVEHKAAFPDVADWAHHGTSKPTKSRPLVSPGIVSAVLNVKLAPAAGAKRTTCVKTASGKCKNLEEWGLEESRDYSEEDDSEEEDSSAEEQDGVKKSVKVVSGLDESIEEEGYGKSEKKIEQNEIPDVPVYSGSFVGVDTDENYNEGLTQQWNPTKLLVGDNRHLESALYYGRGGQFQHPSPSIPVLYNIRGSMFEVPYVRKSVYQPGVHAARAPKPYHSLMAEYGNLNMYPLHEQSTSLLPSVFTVQKQKKEVLNIDDKINFPKMKENLEDVSITLPSTEMSIISKVAVI